MSEETMEKKVLENPFATPGAFSWTELATSDPDASKAFYGEVFGWEFHSMEMPGGSYDCIKVGGALIGGVMKTPCPEGSTVWGTYVTVADVPKVHAKVLAAGGKVVMEPHQVPGVGTMFLFQDPQGALISAIQYEGQDGR